MRPVCSIRGNVKRFESYIVKSGQGPIGSGYNMVRGTMMSILQITQENNIDKSIHSHTVLSPNFSEMNLRVVHVD